MAKDKHGKAIQVGDWVRRADGTMFQVRGVAQGKTSASAADVEVCEAPTAGQHTAKSSDPGDGTIVWD